MNQSPINSGLISKFYNPLLQEKEAKENEFNPFGFDWGEDATKTSEEKAEARKKAKQKQNSLFDFDLMDEFDKKEKESNQKEELANKLLKSGASTASATEFKQSTVDKDLAYAQKMYEQQKDYLTRSDKQSSVDTDLKTANQNKTENRFSSLQSQKAFGTCSLSDAKSGNYNVGGVSGGGGVRGGTYKGTRLASAAESYKTFADNRKNWSEQKLDHSISERKTTLLEQNKRQRAPKADKISKNAGNIDGAVDETKGQQETVGTTSLSAPNAKIAGATHSTGAGEALGQVSGGVEDMEDNFKNEQKDHEGEGIKKVLSGLSKEKSNEENALSDFDSAKAAAGDYENYQEEDAKASDKAAEKAIEEQGNQKNAQEDVENGAQKINQGNSMTNQGNQAVAQSAVEFAQAEEQADEALQMRDEATKLQTEGLKELKEASKQNAKGVQLSRKGDQLIGIGQSLIYTGVPLTYNPLTVPIGVALIQSGLAHIRKGKNKVNQGQNQVRKAEQNRSKGMKNFDKGTQTANESNDKQKEASEINKNAVNKNEQGQTMIANGATLTEDGVSQKNSGQVNFKNAAEATQRATTESNRLAQSAGENYANVQAQIKKTEQCLSTIITAQANAEKLTGLQSDGEQLSGFGDAEQSNINDDQNNNASSSPQLEGLSAGFDMGDGFALSDAMKNHAYKKKRDDKKDDKKDNKKDNKKDIKTAQKEKGNKLGLGVNSKQKNQKQARTQVAANQQQKKVQSIFAPM